MDGKLMENRGSTNPGQHIRFFQQLNIIHELTSKEGERQEPPALIKTKISSYYQPRNYGMLPTLQPPF